MNKNQYRIIFNKARGCLMVVSEAASSVGGSASGERAGGGSGVGSFSLSSISLALGISLALMAPTQAQIRADAAAPRTQQATILQTANGVTQVNIQTPSAAGVSRNVYSQFDVSAAGAILNNSRVDVATQLGGFVQGNPWLATGSARVILNEVNSSNPSQLRGYVEVGGQRAEVVIANPAGINVDGGGFINASRVTLTTGTPIINGGSLDAYRVQSGNVSVYGQGLDVRDADYTSIMARAVQVNAGIWANANATLKVITGANQVAADSTTTTPIAGTGAAPAFALDVANLGGMYAGKIFLIGTEAGLGIRNAGTLAATGGSFVLQANGWLTNTGAVQATGNVQAATQGATTNSGTMVAAGDLDLAAKGGLTLGGQASAGGSLALAAPELNVAGAALTAKNISLSATTGNLNATGAYISADGTLTASAIGQLRSDGGALVGNQVNLAAQSVSNVGGQIVQVGTGDMAINLVGEFDNTRGRLATNAQNLSLSASALDNRLGLIQVLGNVSINVGSLVNIDTLDTNQLNTQGRNFGIEGNNISIISTTFTNSSGAIRADNNVTVSSSGTINNSSGVISAGNMLIVQDTAASKTLALTNTTGKLIAGQTLIIDAANLSGDGQVLSRGNFDLTLSGGFNNTAQVIANNNASINVTGALTNSGKLQAGNTLQVNAANIDNTSTGQISAITTKVNAVNNLTNRGLIDGTTTQITADNTLTNIGTGRIYGDDLSIAAATVNNSAETVAGVSTAAVIAARNKLDIGVGTLNNSNGALIFSAGDMAIGGSLDANRRAMGRADSVNNSGSTIESLGSLHLSSTQLQNTNSDFASTIVQTSGPVQQSYIQPVGTSTKVLSNNFIGKIGAELVNIATTQARRRVYLAYWVFLRCRALASKVAQGMQQTKFAAGCRGRIT